MVTVIGAIVSAVVPTFSVLWVSVYSKQAKVTRNLANLQYDYVVINSTLILFINGLGVLGASFNNCLCIVK